MFFYLSSLKPQSPDIFRRGGENELRWRHTPGCHFLGHKNELWICRGKKGWIKEVERMNSGKKSHPVVYDKSIPLPVLDDIGVNTYDTKGRWLPRLTRREEKQCSVMILDVEVIRRRSKHSFSHVVSVCEWLSVLPKLPITPAVINSAVAPDTCSLLWLLGCFFWIIYFA